MADVPLVPCANCGVPYPADVLRCPRCVTGDGRVKARSDQTGFTTEVEPIDHEHRGVRWRRSLGGTQYAPDGKTADVGPRWVSEEMQQELPIVDLRRPLLPQPAPERPASAPPAGKHVGKGGARMKLIAELERLIEIGDWSKTEADVWTAAKVSKATFYRLSDGEKADALVKALWEEYHRRRRGNGPARRSDL